MTHWVILEHDGKIYAGADELTTGVKDLPSRLSGSGVMPGVHSMDTTNKLVEHSWGEKECVICCAGISYPTPLSNSVPQKKNSEVIKDILSGIDVSKISTAQELMSKVREILTKNYVIDDNPNSVVLGCGFTDGVKNTIAIYDSRNGDKEIRPVLSGYCNSELDTTSKKILPTAMAGENPAVAFIQNEIHAKSMERTGRVGQHTNHASLKKISPSHSPRHFKGQPTQEDHTQSDIIRLDQTPRSQAHPGGNCC